MSSRVLVLTCLVAGILHAGQAVIEPDARAVQLLQLANRYRAAPLVDAKRMRQADDVLIPGLAHDIDEAMFLEELAAVPVAAPLLHDPHLARAALDHAEWCRIHQIVKHSEEEGSQGFTGVRPQDRAKGAGFAKGFVAENCAGPAAGVWCAHLSFVIDWTAKDDPANGGMQPNRGHRRTLSQPKYTRAGMAVVEDRAKRGRYWVVQVIGRKYQEIRRAGGVVFTDANRDGVCDPGEGLKGAAVVLRDADGKDLVEIATPATGAWFIDVPEEATEVRITRVVGGAVEELATRNLGVVPTTWIDLPLASARDLAAYDRVANQLPDGRSQRRAALVQALHLGAGLPFDAERAKGYAAIREELGELDGKLIPFLDDFEERYRTGDHAALRREANTLRTRYRGTPLATWATDAGLLLDSYAAAKEMHDLAVRGRAIPVSQMSRIRRRTRAGEAIKTIFVRNLYRDILRSMKTMGTEYR